jgi:thiol-disulfide isomerase/thioredoxin
MQPTVTLYYTNSDKIYNSLKSEWNKIKKIADIKNIKCIQYESNDSEVSDSAKNMLEDGPYIRLNIDNKKYNYYGSITADNIIKFIEDKSNNNMSEPENKLVLYYANWCGHCENFKPLWKELKNKGIHNVSLLEYEDTDIKTMSANITSYPTLILYVKDTPFKFEGHRTTDNILNFVNNKINKNNTQISNISNISDNTQKSNISDNTQKSDISLVLYSADWCGHCKAFKPIWNDMQNEGIHGVHFEEYVQGTPVGNTKIKEENIMGYPTIILYINDNKHEYNGNRTPNDIKSFVRKMIGENDKYYKKYMKYKCKYTNYKNKRK